MKAKTLLVAAVMFFGLSAVAMAQVATFQVGSIPVTAVTATGQTEKAGSITFTTVLGSGTTQIGTITVSYGVPITNNGANITGTATAGVLPTIGSITNASGVVVINISAGFSGTFTLSGIRVAISGTGLTSLSASMSAVGNALLAGQTVVTVISSISPGIASVTSTVGVINAVTGTVTTQPVLKVKEGYLNAFGIIPPGTDDQTTGVWIRFTLSANPPVGMTIQFPATAATDGTAAFTTVNSDGTANGAAVNITSATTALTVYYQLTTDSDPTQIETMTVPLTVSVDASKATFPLSTVAISATATFAPIGNAFNSSGGLIATPIPRYSVAEVGPASLLGVSGSATAMIVPFASTVSASGYNTGLAVANTTTDPGATAMFGITSAVKQAGTITFYFYPQQVGSTAPVPFSYTTGASSPGTGLDSAGRLPSGSTYTALLSQLLAAASAPADFSGYIIIVTAFTNAHCQYIITDFRAFANGGQAMIIAGNRGATPEGLNH
jgi:hypothetical protein